MQTTNEHFSHGVMRAKEASAFLGLGESTFWRWAKDGRLPKGTRLSARATVWRIADLEAFIERQAASQEGASC